MNFSLVDEILKYIGIMSLILGFFWSIHKLYDRFLKPKRKTSKYHKLFLMIEAWFDEIDKNLEGGINYSLLSNKENKIRQYITDNKIGSDKLKFNNRFKRKFLKFCGIKRSLLDDKELFYKYSRQSVDWTYLEDYINLLFSSFYDFLRDFNLKNGKANFANVEMKIKLLRLYWNYKIK